MFDAMRFKSLLEASGISQGELARRIGISQQTISRLASGERYGSKYLHRIARELQTTPAYLNGETDDPTSDAPDAPELSRDEWAWVEYWRALKIDERDAVVRVVKCLTSRDRQLEVTLHHG